MHWLSVRAALAIAFMGSFYVAPVWLCLGFWYGVVVVGGTLLFLKRVRENRDAEMDVQQRVP